MTDDHVEQMSHAHNRQLLNESAARLAAIRRLRAQAAELVGLPLSMPVADRLDELLAADPEETRAALSQQGAPSLTSRGAHLALVADADDHGVCSSAPSPTPTRSLGGTS